MPNRPRESSTGNLGSRLSMSAIDTSSDGAPGLQCHLPPTPAPSTAADVSGGDSALLVSPDEYKLWAATSKHLAGLSFESECVRILTILENGYPRKTPPEGAAAARSVQHVELPHVPIKWETGQHTRPHFFGWPVTWEWLELFRKCARPYSKHRFGVHGFALRRELSGAGGPDSDFDLTLQVAVHEGVPLPLDDHDDAEPPKELRFDMVSIRDTLSAEGYLGARPTEAHYAWLDAVLPGEARWYKSLWTRQSVFELSM